jgi:DNA-directed RNA polymerase specialized sigma24 family protein
MVAMFTPEEINQLHQRLGAVKRTSHRLTPVQRAQVVTDYIRGASVAEVARRFGVSHTTVRHHIRRVLKIYAAMEGIEVPESE